MQVSLYSSGLKQQTILSTPKTATPLMPLPTPHLMKFDTKINQTSLDFILLVARLMSSYIQRTERSYHQELLKAYQIYMPSKRKIICSVHIKFDVNTNMGTSFKAKGEYQFQYNSLKSLFQEFKPEQSSSPEPVPSTTSSDDIISNPAPSTSNPVPAPNIPEHVPEQVPNAPPPDPPARRQRQPKPPPPPRAPSSRHIKPTDRGDSSRLQKVGQPNTVPFPTDSADANTESNADPGGASANEEPDNQESANIAHGEEPKTHAQAMASPDAAEWLAAERYE